jgi:hypothetical protein
MEEVKFLTAKPLNKLLHAFLGFAPTIIPTMFIGMAQTLDCMHKDTGLFVGPQLFVHSLKVYLFHGLHHQQKGHVVSVHAMKAYKGIEL